MLKYVLAAVFSAAAVYLTGFLNLLVDTALVYGLAVGAGVVFAGISAGEGKNAWAIAAALIGGGAMILWLLDQSWGMYLVALGLGVAGALLALMLTGRRPDPLSAVHDSKRHGH